MKLTLFFLCCVSAVYCATFVELVDPDNSEVCVSSNPDVGIMKYNETKLLKGKCVEATCSPGYIIYLGCGKVLVDSPCVLAPVDLSKPYPQCCPKTLCPID
ncbi:hypothetical protein RN001_011725 [Aquatica leii]|uniref:Single domain-containing protein n=1 Tax=Aquatica leii TaxID=1421715 RepID=A0AAN7P4J1_9COLE|nr:hypothetical protein RN001_011725 [Aquatica leii]